MSPGDSHVQRKGLLVGNFVKNPWEVPRSYKASILKQHTNWHWHFSAYYAERYCESSGCGPFRLNTEVPNPWKLQWAHRSFSMRVPHRENENLIDSPVQWELSAYLSPDKTSRWSMTSIGNPMCNRWVMETQTFCGLSITHRWHRLLIDVIDYSSMTHRSLNDYYAHERHYSCFLVPLVSVSDSFICVRRIFSCIWSSSWPCGDAKC